MLITAMLQGRPYIVEPDQEDGTFFLSLGRPDDTAAALEVMKDAANGFYGFRAQAAEDRFLQANKRRSRRLLLFNHNFGTNEQWKLLQLPEHSWTKLACSFQHRRNEVWLAPYKTFLEFKDEGELESFQVPIGPFGSCCPYLHMASHARPSMA